MSNSIWKTPNQKPISGKWICIFDGFDYQIDNPNPDCWDDMFVEKWCYFHDLVAQADKAERLQKAVDYALQVLDNVSEIGGIDLEIIKIKQLIKENQ